MRTNVQGRIKTLKLREGRFNCISFSRIICQMHGCKKPVAEVAVLPEKISNLTENFWKNTEKIWKNTDNFMRF